MWCAFSFISCTQLLYTSNVSLKCRFYLLFIVILFAVSVIILIISHLVHFLSAVEFNIMIWLFIADHFISYFVCLLFVSFIVCHFNGSIFQIIAPYLYFTTLLLGFVRGTMVFACGQVLEYLCLEDPISYSLRRLSSSIRSSDIKIDLVNRHQKPTLSTW